MKNTDSDRGGYSIDRFADQHDVSRSQVYIEIRSGRLEARKIGSRTLITIEAAERWRKSLPKFPIAANAGQDAHQHEVAEESAPSAGPKRRRVQQIARGR
jgi:hypothetical protein